MLMPMTEVELERDSGKLPDPMFPSRCIVCDRDDPGHHVNLTARLNGMTPTKDAAFLAHRSIAPACRECQFRLKSSRLMGKMTFGLATLVGAAVFIAYLELAPQWARNDWMGYAGIVAVGLIGWGANRYLYTPYFDFSPWGYRVVYSFRSDKFAAEFAELNSATIKD
jgi:hypothetical protein